MLTPSYFCWYFGDRFLYELFALLEMSLIMIFLLWNAVKYWLFLLSRVILRIS
jgi:hypothetical protein